MINIPKDIKTDFGVVTLNYSRHAQSRVYRPEYGQIHLPPKLDTSIAEVIQIDLVTKKLGEYKVVYKTVYNDFYDIILVVIPQGWFVKTVWLRDYDRNSLRKDKYANG